MCIAPSRACRVHICGTHDAVRNVVLWELSGTAGGGMLHTVGYGWTMRDSPVLAAADCLSWRAGSAPLALYGIWSGFGVVATIS